MHSLPPHSPPSNGVHASLNYKSHHTPTLNPKEYTQSSFSTSATTNINIINTDTHTSALPASVYQNVNTTAVQNSNNCKTTTPYQRNCPSAIGTPRTISTTTAPFASPITTPTIKHGPTNTCAFKIGNPLSTGHTSNATPLESIRLAICQTPHQLHPHGYSQTPFSKTTTQTTDDKTTHSTHKPTPTRSHRSPRTQQTHALIL